MKKRCRGSRCRYMADVKDTSTCPNPYCRRCLEDMAYRANVGVTRQRIDSDKEMVEEARCKMLLARQEYDNLKSSLRRKQHQLSRLRETAPNKRDLRVGEEKLNGKGDLLIVVAKGGIRFWERKAVVVLERSKNRELTRDECKRIVFCDKNPLNCEQTNLYIVEGVLRELFNCQHCGKVCARKMHSPHAGKFCSLEHYRAWCKIQRNNKLVLRRCKNCNREFKVLPDDTKTHCSVGCYRRLSSAMASLRKREQPCQR